MLGQGGIVTVSGIIAQKAKDLLTPNKQREDLDWKESFRECVSEERARGDLRRDSRR